MKKLVLGLLAAVLLSSAAGGSYWAYNEYTVLSSKEVQSLVDAIVQDQYRAYLAGTVSCNKTI